MSTPIHFQGTDYESVEAMPAHIRRAYEQSQRDQGQPAPSPADDKDDEDEDEDGDEAEAVAGGAAPEAEFQPAWGGPRPDGGVPVPPVFEAVSGLGPALEVHDEVPDIQLLPNWGTPLARAAVRYRDGLAYRTFKDKTVHTLRWEDVAAILTNNHFHLNYTERQYTLVTPSGEKLILDDTVKELGRLLAYIEKAVYERLGPPLADAYRSGQPQMFGPVTVGRASGLALGGATYAWDAIQDVKVENGRFKVTLRDGKKHEARANAIPNIELLCQLIGVKLISSDLATV